MWSPGNVSLNRVILKFKGNIFLGSWSPMSYYISVVCIQRHRFLSTCGACLEFVLRGIYFGSLRATFILAPVGMPR